MMLARVFERPNPRLEPGLDRSPSAPGMSDQLVPPAPMAMRYPVARSVNS